MSNVGDIQPHPISHVAKPAVDRDAFDTNVCLDGARGVIRDTSAQRTIGGGRFLDLWAPSRKRRTPDRMAQLAAHAVADPGDDRPCHRLLSRPSRPCGAIGQHRGGGLPQRGEERIKLLERQQRIGKV